MRSPHPEVHHDFHSLSIIAFFLFPNKEKLLYLVLLLPFIFFKLIVDEWLVYNSCVTIVHYSRDMGWSPHETYVVVPITWNLPHVSKTLHNIYTRVIFLNSIY
jgi:hypothetical protein